MWMSQASTALFVEILDLEDRNLQIPSSSSCLQAIPEGVGKEEPQN